MRLLPRGVLLGSATLLALLAGSAVPATADDTIRTQWYVTGSGITELHQQGLDGSGLTIAVIDAAPPDTTVPELRGAAVEVTDPCRDRSSRADVVHTTAVLSVLASPDFGWAPKARYHVYVRPTTNEPEDAGCAKDDAFMVGALINRALDDGADLISIQVSESVVDWAGYAVARATLLDVPVVAAVGNGAERTILTTARMNYTVGVGAADRKGHRAAFSDRGKPLSITAPGVGVKARSYGPDGRLSVVGEHQGTSYAAPMVSGALALAMQRWPAANTNQLVADLLTTAVRDGNSYDDQLGWGLLDARRLVATDPAAFPTDVSPLANKSPGDVPTAEQFADYRDGLVNPADLRGDNAYVYRGEDAAACDAAARCELGTSPRLSSTAPAASSAAPSDSGTSGAGTAALAPATAPPSADGSGIGLGIGLGIAAAVVVAGAVTAVIVVRRKQG